MKISKEESGLHPQDFLDKKDIWMQILDIQSEEATSKKSKKKYTQYSLKLLGTHKQWTGEYTIKYLFARDLHGLIDAYGEDTDQWKGKGCNVSSAKEGDYHRWRLTGRKEQ